MSTAAGILDREAIERMIVRLAHEIVERNGGETAGESASPFAEVASQRAGDETKAPSGKFALVGIHRRGAVLATRLKRAIDALTGDDVPLGTLDISFYRDDLNLRRDREPAPAMLAPVLRATEIDFAIDDLTIVIVDDVLYTGRTARAAIDALFDYGRPARIQLATLIDRGHRELPIRPDFVGKNLPTSLTQRVYVKVDEIDGEDAVSVESAPLGYRGTK